MAVLDAVFSPGIVKASFETTDHLDVVEQVDRDDDLAQRIVAGSAHVGIKLPEDFCRQLAAGQMSQMLVLVDGSESSVLARR